MDGIQQQSHLAYVTDFCWSYIHRLQKTTLKLRVAYGAASTIQVKQKMVELQTWGCSAICLFQWKAQDKARKKQKTLWYIQNNNHYSFIFHQLFFFLFLLLLFVFLFEGVGAVAIETKSISPT